MGDTLAVRTFTAILGAFLTLIGGSAATLLNFQLKQKDTVVEGKRKLSAAGMKWYQSSLSAIEAELEETYHSANYYQQNSSSADVRSTTLARIVEAARTRERSRITANAGLAEFVGEATALASIQPGSGALGDALWRAKTLAIPPLRDAVRNDEIKIAHESSQEYRDKTYMPKSRKSIHDLVNQRYLVLQCLEDLLTKTSSKACASLPPATSK